MLLQARVGWVQYIKAEYIYSYLYSYYREVNSIERDEAERGICTEWRLEIGVLECYGHANLYYVVVRTVGGLFT